MTDLSRRTLAKGAAWTVPTLTLVSGAPAFAASTDCVDTYTCPAVPMTMQDGSAPSATVAAGNGRYPGGSYFAIALGQWNVHPVSYTHSCPGKPAEVIDPTGYYINLGTWGGSPGSSNGQGPVSNVTNRNGVHYEGYMTASTPVAASPQVGFAGLSMQANVQTSIPYTGASCSKAQNLGTISIPFTITFLRGTTPVAKSCSYTLNMNFNNATLCSPTIGATYTITAA